MKRVLGLWVAVACGEVLLLAADSGGPRLAEPRSWSPWLATRPPEDAVLALVRLAGLAGGAYLLLVIGIGVLLRMARLDVLVAWADACTPRSLRAVLDRTTVAVAVSVSATLGSALPVAAAEGPPITLRGLQGPTRSREPTTTTTVLAPTPEVVAEGRVPVPLEPVEQPVPTTPAVPIEPVEPVAEPPPTPERQPLTYEAAPAPTGGRTWTVQPGDHFWSIAERVLAEAWQRPVGDGEVAPYWRTLVADNRGRLADPGNPDLLFAGQVLSVPDVRPAPG